VAGHTADGTGLQDQRLAFDHPEHSAVVPGATGPPANDGGKGPAPSEHDEIAGLHVTPP
jgi:hypothetical protein